MLSGRVVRNVNFPTVIRCFTCSNAKWESKVDKNIIRDTIETSQNEEVLGKRMHHVTNFDKRLLVWVKRYPSMADVPKVVTDDCMHSSRSKARNKISTYMMIFGTIGFIYAKIIGKKKHEQGESLFTQEWFKKPIKEK